MKVYMTLRICVFSIAGWSELLSKTNGNVNFWSDLCRSDRMFTISWHIQDILNIVFLRLDATAKSTDKSINAALE